jgi:hypothetical protein
VGARQSLKVVVVVELGKMWVKVVVVLAMVATAVVLVVVIQEAVEVSLHTRLRPMAERALDTAYLLNLRK